MFDFNFLSGLLTHLGSANSLFAGQDIFQPIGQSRFPLKSDQPISGQTGYKNISYSSEVPALNSIMRTSGPGNAQVVSPQIGMNYKGNNPMKQSNASPLKMGGPVGVSEGQLEKYKGITEQIVLPTGNIYKSNAKKSHERMKDDEVTDLLPEEAYVGSSRPKMEIKKKDIDNISFGFGAVEYEPEKGAKMPKEFKYADVFTKNKMKPAEVFQSIKRKFPVTDRKDDPFADAAVEANLEARMPYIQTTMLLDSLNVLEDEMNSILPKYAYGGMNKKRKVTKYADPLTGELAKLAFQGISGLFQSFFNAKAAKQANKQAQKNQERIDENTNLNNVDINRASELALMSTLLQDDKYHFLDEQEGFKLAKTEALSGFNEADRAIANSADTQIGRIFGALNNVSSNLFNNTSSFSRGAAAASTLLPGALRSASDVNARASLDRANLGVRKGLTAAGYSEKGAMDRQGGLNYQVQFNNSKLGAAGDIGVNRINQQMANRNAGLQATLINSGQNAANMQNFVNNQNSIIQDTMFASGQALANAYASRSQPTVSQGAQTTVSPNANQQYAPALGTSLTPPVSPYSPYYPNSPYQWNTGPF